MNIAGGLHHAMAARASGFCVYNDPAVAIARLLDLGAQRIAYVDVDVHHGDGVQAAFYDDPRVLTVSLHETPLALFPGTGFPDETGGPGAEGTAVNVALPPGTDDAGWLRAFHAVVPSVLRAFAPAAARHPVRRRHPPPRPARRPAADRRRAAGRLPRAARRSPTSSATGRWVATGGGGYALVEVVPAGLDPPAGGGHRRAARPGHAAPRRPGAGSPPSAAPAPRSRPRMTDGVEPPVERVAAGHHAGPGGPGDRGDPDGGLPAARARPARHPGLSAVAGDKSADVLLSDGSAVHLRPIRPEDAPAIVELHSRMCDRTRYLRYFSPYPRIPERDLDRFVNVDHHDREAFVVVTGSRIMAVGRYERLGPDSPDAEVAFVVEDAHQGRGIGSVLLEHLAEAARENGITRFVAEVLPQNGGMLRVFSDFGYQVQRQYADGVVHLSFPIAPTEKSREVQESREQRTEARSIARLLSPRGVAVYGASASGQGIGAAVLGHLRDGGYTGPIVPVHRRAERVAGLPAYRSAVDARRRGRPGADRRAAGRGCRGRGGRGRSRSGRPGGGLGRLRRGRPAGRGRPARSWSTTAHAAGLRVVGPNCLGIANTDPAVRLNATLAPAAAGGRPGRLLQPVRRARVSPCSPRPTAAASACPASSRPATAPTSPATTCCSTGRTTRAPTSCCSTWRRSATRASSPGWPAG